MNRFCSLAKFQKEIGVSYQTLWRWRQRGWLKTITIAGNPYVTNEAIQEFLRRAEAGDFKIPTTYAAKTQLKQEEP